MNIDIRDNTIQVGDTVACIPESTFRILVVAEVLQIHQYKALVRYNLPPNCFSGKQVEGFAYYDNMVKL